MRKCLRYLRRTEAGTAWKLVKINGTWHFQAEIGPD